MGYLSMGCGQSSPEHYVSPDPPPIDDSATGVPVTCHHRVSAYENQKFLKLPGNLTMHSLPPAFAGYLTPAAWTSICEIVRDSFPQEEVASVANKLASFYPSLVFTASWQRTHENSSKNDRYTVNVDKLSSIRVLVPPGVAPGEEFEFTVPESAERMRVRAPPAPLKEVEVKY